MRSTPGPARPADDPDQRPCSGASSSVAEPFRVHLAKVDSADSSERRRTIRAGHRAIRTVANDHVRRRPRDGRGMSGGVDLAGGRSEVAAGPGPHARADSPVRQCSRLLQPALEGSRTTLRRFGVPSGRARSVGCSQRATTTYSLPAFAPPAMALSRCSSQANGSPAELGRCSRDVLSPVGVL